ncbi:MAG: ParB N-terminal domain-containing protein [Anaerolineales bacterium]|nr:ParB N-terminal domain-containing protein [Anaerolineales bacterium]
MKNDRSPRKILSMAANPSGQRDAGQERVARDFEQAHRRAFMQDALALVRYEPVDLLPFELVREKLHLSNKYYLGLQEIPLEQIVGSVGRYEDFTRTFMPRKSNSRQRWEKIDSMTDTGGWPPIEVYKVSDTYFVRDGNHRVSVARQLGAETIEAYVWEYPTRVPLESDDDIDDLIVREEYLEFLDSTELDKLRPDQWIILTQPGGYWEMEESIALHRHWKSWDMDTDIPWHEAVADWYDTIYMPLATKIREEGTLTLFPGRTEADLVVWVLRHWTKLERDYGGEEVEANEAVEDFAERTRSNPFRRTWAWFERTVLANRWMKNRGEDRGWKIEDGR